MRINFKAMESYGADNLMSQASVADGAELIQMLFDGLVNSIAEAQGHIERGAILEKGKSITRWAKASSLMLTGSTNTTLRTPL